MQVSRMYYYLVGAIRQGSVDVRDIPEKSIPAVRQYMYHYIMRYWNERHDKHDFSVFKAGQTKSTRIGIAGAVKHGNSIIVVWMENKKGARLRTLNPDGSLGDLYKD